LVQSEVSGIQSVFDVLHVVSLGIEVSRVAAGDKVLFPRFLPSSPMTKLASVKPHYITPPPPMHTPVASL